jgi:hypothetical protein
VQPPIRFGESHPEKLCSATKTRPGCPAIPQSQRSHCNWLNHFADRYASLNSQATADHHMECNLWPGKIFYINAVVLLREVISRESFYWLYDGAPPPVPPAPPAPNLMEASLFPDLWMPTAIPVGLLYSTNDQTLDYLLQRDLKVYPLLCSHLPGSVQCCATSAPYSEQVGRLSGV